MHENVEEKKTVLCCGASKLTMCTFGKLQTTFTPVRHCNHLRPHHHHHRLHYSASRCYIQLTDMIQESGVLFNPKVKHWIRSELVEQWIYVYANAKIVELDVSTYYVVYGQKTHELPLLCWLAYQLHQINWKLTPTRRSLSLVVGVVVVIVIVPTLVCVCVCVFG